MALKEAGVNERWMDWEDMYIDFPVGDDEPKGVFHPRANMAAAVWLWGEQGWQAWSPSQELPPAEYEPPKPGRGVWWVDGLGYRRLRSAA